MSIKTPVGVKYNNRYRGPHESYKANSTYAQARYNINKLKKRVDELEKIKNDVLQKPININKDIASISALAIGIETTIEKIINYEVVHSDE